MTKTGLGWMSAAAALVMAVGGPVGAQTLPPVSIGAGMQTSFVHTEPDGGDGTDAFVLNSIRLYLSGNATDKIKIMFNTDYDGVDNDVNVLDAVGQIAFSSKANIWFGRFLPPSDRANLYGPYYSHHWAVYSDGVQDGYPFIYQGRANGAMYWGQFGKVKVAGGAFDGTSLTGDDTLLSAGRVQVDLWDPEDGYYQNGTYYGDKNLLAIGVAGQVQGEDKSAYNVDFLMERKVTGGGAVSVEAEWAKYDRLGGYSGRYGTDDGGYILGAYLFPQMVGMGRFEILGKFAKARFREGITRLDLDYDQKTTEIDFNYVIKQFNARVMVFFKNTSFDAVRTDFKQFGVGLQLQM
ncbi:MAG: hypothetical protein HOP16_10445 [Acidobacteria bacterium]|nr:hypothetical protein [Acidobacteriota bacterium]